MHLFMHICILHAYIYVYIHIHALKNCISHNHNLAYVIIFQRSLILGSQLFPKVPVSTIHLDEEYVFFVTSL